METARRRVVVVASKAELTHPVYSKRLWLAVRNTPFSTRQWPNVIDEAIQSFHGLILCPRGLRWPVPYVDKTMGSSRGLAYYLEERDGEPRRSVRNHERSRLLDLWFRLERPGVQRHFGR